MMFEDLMTKYVVNVERAKDTKGTEETEGRHAEEIIRNKFAEASTNFARHFDEEMTRYFDK